MANSKMNSGTKKNDTTGKTTGSPAAKSAGRDASMLRSEQAAKRRANILGSRWSGGSGGSSAAKAKSKGSSASVQRAKNIAVRVIGIMLIVALVVYVGYQVYFWFFARMETVTAMTVTASESISAIGIAVRDETVITTTQTGVIVSCVENGAKVSKGETVANIFASADDAAAYHRIAEIDTALAQFASMSTAAEDSAAGIDSIEKQLGERLAKFSAATFDGRLTQATLLSDDILYLLNKSQVATKAETEGFSGRVSELRAERDSLTGKYTAEPHKLTAPMSGYYISDIDGYETILNRGIIDGLTPQKFDGVLSAYHEPGTALTVGKIADDYVWNIICEVTPDRAARLTEGSNYKIYLPYSDTESITAQLQTITVDEEEKRALLIFKCTYMVSDLSVFREQLIKIELSSFTGLQVDESCIVYQPREVETETSSGDVITEVRDCPGVYILWGNEVKYRWIDIIYSADGKAICGEGSGSGWLKRYDEIAVKTKGLYDGKIVLGAA